MKQNEAVNLKVGDQIVLGQAPQLADSALPARLAGTIQTLIRVDHGNEEYFFKDASIGSELYVYASAILKKVGKSSSKKLTKFNREAVKTLFNVGGNDRMKAEIVIRVHEARKNLETAVSPEKFRDSMKVVDEQLRQAKLLHNALVKFD